MKENIILILTLSVNLAYSWAIIDTDDRSEFYQITQAKYQPIKKATAAIIPKKYLVKTVSGFVVAEDALTYQEYANLCPGVRFAEQLSLADCSGFLGENNKFVTAAHCLAQTNSCKNSFIVFDYKTSATGEAPSSFSFDQVHELDCGSIKKDKALDYAIVDFSRQVYRAPLKVASKFKLLIGDKVFMVGAPHGIPFKFTDNGYVMPNSYYSNEEHFETSLDVFAGNSGSAIIDSKSLEVVGILVVGFGEFDEKVDNKTGKVCQVPAIRTGDDVTPSWGLKSDHFASFIQ